MGGPQAGATLVEGRRAGNKMFAIILKLGSQRRYSTRYSTLCYSTMQSATFSLPPTSTRPLHENSKLLTVLLAPAGFPASGIGAHANSY